MLAAISRCNFHLRIALFFTIAHLPVLAMLYFIAPGSKLQQSVTLFIISVTAVTIMVPYLLRNSLIKRWFCWVDVLTTKEREMLQTFNLRIYRDFERSGSYSKRVTPYIDRIIMLGIVLCLLAEYIESAISILFVATCFYLLVLLLVIAVSLILLTSTTRR
jgi:hypothetical protein